MSTFTIPNTSKISAVCIFMEDGKPSVSHVPILGWIIDDDPEKNEFEPRVASPILLENLCENETLGILLEDGRVIEQEVIVYQDATAFSVGVDNRWHQQQKRKVEK